MKVVHISAATTPATASEHDLLDYLDGSAGVAGVVIALAAFIYSLIQAERTKREQIRERRIEFELGLLAETRRALSVTGLQHLAGFVGALIVEPTNETEMPVLRAAVGTKSTAKGRAKHNNLRQEARNRGEDPLQVVVRHAESEVDAAIQTRLEK